MGIISVINEESEALRNLGTERLNKLDMTLSNVTNYPKHNTGLSARRSWHTQVIVVSVGDVLFSALRVAESRCAADRIMEGKVTNGDDSGKCWLFQVLYIDEVT